MDPHRWYTGTSVLPLVDVDHYAFEGSAGQTVVIRTTNTLETNGTHCLRIGMATGAYGFAFALDGEPPSPFRI